MIFPLRSEDWVGVKQVEVERKKRILYWGAKYMYNPCGGRKPAKKARVTGEGVGKKIGEADENQTM